PQTAKVFVGSLPPGCKPEELRHLFTGYGNVVECDIMNRCGFVHLETIEMADAAIAALNGVEFKGQSIVVEPGRLKDKRGGGAGAVGGAEGGGAGVGVAGGAGSVAPGNRRPMQGKPSEQLLYLFITRSTFPAGHGAGSFRRGGGSSRTHDTHYAPMRSEGHYRAQRSAPYHKAAPQQQQHSNYDGYKQRFSQTAAQSSHNDYHAASAGSQRGGGGGGGAAGAGAGTHIGQDRRGFALPAVEHHHQHHHHQQQQQAPPPPQRHFGNGDMFQRNRSNATGMQSPSTQSARGGFHANRGGYAARGGGYAGNRRGGSSSMPHAAGGYHNKHQAANGHQQQAANSYQT
ncbi:hypothetical protein KR222_003623, partial [Zaprionus bogoriensis]